MCRQGLEPSGRHPQTSAREECRFDPGHPHQSAKAPLTPFRVFYQLSAIHSPLGFARSARHL